MTVGRDPVVVGAATARGAGAAQGPALQVGARFQAGGGEVGQTVVVAGDAPARRRDRVGGRHVARCSRPRCRRRLPSGPSWSPARIGGYEPAAAGSSAPISSQELGRPGRR